MIKPRVTPLVLLALVAAACSRDSAGPGAAASATEPLLAQQSQGIAQEVLSSTRTTLESLLQHALTALHDHPDPEAEACLAEARALHHDARAAHGAGDLEQAARLAHQSLLKLLCVVVAVFPDAAERTGHAADVVVGRIEQWLAGHDAPHIREVLEHVKELRSQAERELVTGNTLAALALNLRATQILHRLADHLPERHDHDAVAFRELYGIEY